MAKRSTFLAAVMAVVITFGVIPQPAAYAGGEWWKQALVYLVGGAVVNELTGTKKQQVKGWNSTITANQERNMEVFNRLPVSTRENYFEANTDRWFFERYGQKKDVVWLIHQDLVAEERKNEAKLATFQEAQLEILRAQVSPQPQGIPIRTEGRLIERVAENADVRLYGHLRGGEAWVFVPSDEADFARYDWLNILLRDIPGKVTVVGEIDGQKVERIWCSTFKLVDPETNDWAKKTVEERDAEIRNKDGWLVFRPLAFKVPENAKRMSLQVNIWRTEIFSPQPDEQTSFVQVVREEIKGTGGMSSNGRILPPLNRGEVRLSAAEMLPDTLWAQTAGTVSDIHLASALPELPDELWEQSSGSDVKLAMAPAQ